MPGHCKAGSGYDTSPLHGTFAVTPGAAATGRSGVQATRRTGNTQAWILLDQMIARQGPSESRYPQRRGIGVEDIHRVLTQPVQPGTRTMADRPLWIGIHRPLILKANDRIVLTREGGRDPVSLPHATRRLHHDQPDRRHPEWRATPGQGRRPGCIRFGHATFGPSLRPWREPPHDGGHRARSVPGQCRCRSACRLAEAHTNPARLARQPLRPPWAGA